MPQDIYWVQPRVVVTSKQKVNFSNAELFPNPTSGILNNPNQYELMVFDYQSKLILKSSEALLDVSKLNSGVYFVRYQVQEGVFNTTRIVVTK